MSVNIFHSNKPRSFNDCYFAEPTIKQELASYANNPLNGCVLLYGAYGTGKSTAVELIARDRGAAKSDIHYVHTNGSQFGELRKSSLLINAMQWGVINHQTPVLVVDEVDILSKENQLWLRSFIDSWQHRALILLTTNYIGNLNGSIRDRCDCMEVKGFTALQAAGLIHTVLAQHDIRIAVTRIEQQVQLELSSEDALLSLRTVGRLCDKLALQVSQPKLRIVKNKCQKRGFGNVGLKPTVLKLEFQQQQTGSVIAARFFVHTDIKPQSTSMLTVPNASIHWCD